MNPASTRAIADLCVGAARLKRIANRITLRRALAPFVLSMAFVHATGPAHAEGSRTLFPAGSLSSDAGGTPNATRSLLYYGNQTYIGIVRQQNFFYVYAEAGEYILLGTSGARNALRLFAPPAPGQSLADRFGTPGLEDTASLGTALTLSGTNCSSTDGNIANRTAELAGPNSANNSVTVPNGYAPCYYAVTTTGVHGVFFGTATNTNMWDVTVRSSANSLTDISGRLFTYSLAANTNGANNRTYATHYYVTNDGYRYSQTMRGLAPFAYVLYSNPRGFLDVDGNPLYKNVRSQGSPVLDSQANGSYFRPANTGIQAQRPTYPMFFSNVVDAGVDTATGLQATLNALGIPLAPQHPVALSASFQHAHTGGSTTYVGQGGVFSISTQNALTYQIVLKGGNTPAHDDPAHADNRVLTGLATGLNQQVYWDGLTNAGAPMPAGSGYTFEATGRAGEVHFPFLDAEANLSGGPTVTRLNGADAPNSIVYYDDRGYTTNGVNVGTPGGHLCGGTAGASNEQPDPLYSLTGVDSSNGNLNGTGKYYRSWGSTHTGNTGNDCAANGYFGDAKGMDMWALIRSAPPAGALSLDILNVADVTATASIPESVAPGGTVVIVANFGNVGSQTAAGTAYTVQLPSNLAGGVSCSGATCSYDTATGLVTITGLPTALSPGQWTKNVMLGYTAPASGNIPVAATITTTSAQPTAPAPQAPDTASGSTLVAVGGTTADVLAQLDAPLTAAPGGVVSVSVTIRNLGPLAAANVGYALTLPSGLTGVSCSTPAICNYNSGTGVIAVSGLPVNLNAAQATTLTLTYAAPGSGVASTTATVTTTTAENDTTNNTASALTTVSTAAFADVTTSVAPPAQAVGATTVNVPVTFRNLGPLPAAGVTYTVTLSSGLSGVSCSSPVTCSYNSGTGALALTAGAPATLQNGQILSFTVSYTAPPTGTVSFASTITTTTGDSNTNNNSVAAQTAIVANTHTVTFDSNGGSAVGNLTNVTHGNTITAPTPPTRLGYVFAGWYKEPALTNAWNFATDTVTSATTLYARWQIIVYTLSYSAGANGSIIGATSQSVNYGGSGTAVTAVASSGYHFVSWSDGVTTATRTDTNITVALSVTASFAIDTYSLTYSAGANGSISGATSQTVNHGGNATAVTAVPNPGYHFVSWSDGVTTAARTDLNLTSNLNVSASFAVGHTLTYTAGGQGTLTGNTSQSVSHGGSGTAVTAVPNAGFEFFRWSDGLSSATRIDSNVVASLAVVAYFSQSTARDLRLHEESDFGIPAGSTLSSVRITRGGQQTTIDSPSPADYGDWLECSGTSCRFSARRSGRYEMTFVDASGNAQIVVFSVHPNIGFSSPRQSVDAGSSAQVRIVLDDLPITEQLAVNYSIQNGAAIGSPQPSDLLTRNPQQLIFDVGPSGQASCFATGHCFEELTFMANAAAGEIGFFLHDSDGVVIGDYASHTVVLASAASNPLTADLVLLPGHTVTVGTPITASLVNLPAGNYRFDWSGSEASLGIGAATAATVAPSTGVAGNYLIRVVIHDLDHPNRPSIELQTWVRVIAAQNVDDVCGPAGCDDDGSRIPLDRRVPRCDLSSNDPAGVVPYRLQVGVKGWTWSTENLCLETQPGYGLRLGATSFLSSPGYGAGIERATIQQFGNGGRAASNTEDRVYTHVGLYYDFEVTSLDTAGQSVAVVIPLPRNLTIPNGALWRQYHPVDGWATFTADARNTLHSAPRNGDECPSPVANVWASQPGLVAGMDCVRLVIQDGGPNDADRKVNAVVADLGTLAVAVAQEEITVTSTGRKGGGGSMNPLTLLLGALFLLRRRAYKLLPIVALAGIATLAHADEETRPSGWLVGATAAQARGEVGSSDVTRDLAELGIPATARVEDQNRFGWRVFGGYRFNEHLSLDGGFTNLGKAITRITGVPVDLEEIPHALPASGAGWELSAAGYLPVSERVDLYARIGAWHWKTLYHALETGQKRRPKASGFDPLGGLGVQYWHNAKWQGRLSWDRYRVDRQDVDLLGISVVYRFGNDRSE